MEHIEDEIFEIDNDQKAEWALRKIKSVNEEYGRLIALCDDEISRYKAFKLRYEHELNNKKSYFISLLNNYFETIKPKETKTQATYKLASGKLIKKLPQAAFIHDEETLIQMLKDTKFVENKQVLKWAEYKKTLQIIDDKVIDENGEIVEGIKIQIKPAVFDVDVK